MKSAILVIAHGSRRAEANEDLERLAEMLRRRRPDQLVEIAYLELADPDIPTAAARCIAQGAEEVRMLPYFLSAGAHVSEDLEAFQNRFAEEYPDVRFRLSPPLGLHPHIVDVLLERLEEAT